ncbi:alpha/beta hydrolase family protein [Microtetraspora malaysiensis]|uniref:alpha/beta hydrolase family protein n=1 Tax=Microtetraspora malaysiensis TaxID=161358 RepID=UPI00082E50AB|nr:alpha/beta fold hydrolase [Microtetraspora malaysiensis]
MASRRKWWIGATVTVALLAGGTGYGAWYGSQQAIGVVHYGSDNTNVLAGRPGAVTLTETPETTRPGVYWLEWSGASTMLGEVVSRAPGLVTRQVLRGAVPSVGTPGYFTAVPPGDPQVSWGVGFTEFMVPTELGPAPAWYVPGKGDTWVVAVHGQNGRRKAELKILPALRELDLPFLVISYRNDEGAPPSPDGLLHLGDTEWRDLEAALHAARERGARRFVLYGTSMGGTVIGQFLRESSLAGTVDRVVLDAPMSDLVTTAEQGARRVNFPGFLGRLSSLVVEWRTGVDADRLSLIANPPKARPPMLVIHTLADEEHPISESRDLAAVGKRLGWPIRLEEFTAGGHTEGWNTDRPRYERLVRDFLAN